MAYTIESEIDFFQSFAASDGLGLRVERPCEYGIVVRPAGATQASSSGKSIGLTLMALTHGNEWAGIAALNSLLALLSSGAVALRIPVAFILGNPWAARENKRFLERDLNRSFAKRQPEAKEELRARDLGALLRESAFILDYHQTSRRSDRPFFIFPYHAPSFAFARAVGPRQTIVTHWGKPFSAEGMCSDEFVIAAGGAGISLELGQNGFDPYQVSVGVECGLWAIRAATAQWEGTPPDAFRERQVPAEPELFTWADIMPWPDARLVVLDEGWHNFKDVAAGQTLGSVDGQPLVARVPGMMLFPKYLTADQQRSLASRPTELCRIMRRIGLGDLPKI